MDGKTLTRMLAEVLNEDPDTSGFVPEGSRIAYDLLWQAAIEFNNRTKMLRDTQEVTTVADTAAYVLDADFQQLYVKDDDARFFIRYTDGSSNDQLIYYKDEEIVFFGNNTTSIAVPGYFYIKDKELSTPTRTGTETTGGSLSAGETTLTDSAATFVTWDIWPGDTIHNTTDGSTGYVLSVTDETHLVCALFDGTNNFFTNSDAYVIVHQPRLQIVTDQPCLTAAETITVPFIQRPKPVYSNYGSYRFPAHFTGGLVRGAAWIMKYRDRDIQGGDTWAKAFERAVNQANMVGRGTFQKRGYKAYFRKR